MRAMSSRQASLGLLGLLAGRASAATAYWTVTSYYVVQPTTSTALYGDYTYTFTDTLGVKPTATGVDADDAVSTSVYTDSYDDVKVVNIYLPSGAVDDDDVMTTTTYDPDIGGVYTDYVVPVEYTAPSSCDSAFTYTTWTNVYVPYEVRGQLTLDDVSTSYYTYVDGDVVTQVTAYLASGAVPTTTTLDPWDNFDYSYYVANCQHPTSRVYSGDDGDDGDRYGGGRYDDYCYGYRWCNHFFHGWVIAVATIIPSLFVLGFVESFVWFNRLMVGKNALRLGTILWILLALPVLCFTRNTPGRDAQTRARLAEQWKAVPFGKKIGLWFKWGFRHRYPVELLGHHPMYANPAPDMSQQQQPPPGMGQMPPPGGFIYYAPGPAGPAPDGQQQQGVASGPPPPEGYKYFDPSQFQGGMPPPGMVLYYPQQPPQAYGQQQPYPPQMAPPPTQHPTARGPEVSPVSPSIPTSASPELPHNTERPSTPSELSNTRGEERGESSTQAQNRPPQ